MTTTTPPSPCDKALAVPNATKTSAVIEVEIDFESDAPLAVCGLRNNGDTVCEVCQ